MFSKKATYHTKCSIQMSYTVRSLIVKQRSQYVKGWPKASLICMTCMAGSETRPKATIQLSFILFYSEDTGHTANGSHYLCCLNPSEM